MSVGSYLRLKGRSSFFRRKVPDHLRVRLARTEICANLGVVNRESAERGARRVAVAVDAFFVSAWRDMSLTGADLSKVVASTIAAWRESDERHDDRMVLANGRTLGSARENAVMFVELAETALEAHASGTSLHDGPYVESRFAAAGLESPSDKEGLHRAGRGLTLGLATYYLGAAIELADRHDLGRGLRGLPVERWRAHHGKLLLQLLGERTLGLPPATAQAPVPASATGVALPAAERSADQALYAGGVSLLGGSDQLFSTLIVESLKRRITSRELAKSALQDAQSTIRIWTEVCGDRPLHTYRRADVSRFQEVLVKLPKYYWRSDREREKPILQVIAEASATNSSYARVQNTTVNRHVCVIGPFFDWAIRHDKMAKPANPFWTGFILQTGAAVTGLEANEERPGWPDDQIQKFFQHPVYTGRRSEYFYNEAGTVIVRDGLYWSPIIAGLHGMRREEFSQLMVRHVRKVEGIWVFDLHAKDLDLKTSWSRRYVPLHRDMLALGFLEQMVTGRWSAPIGWSGFDVSA